MSPSERVQRWALEHWLALLNVAAGVFAGLPVLAPWLLSRGWSTPALLIYAVYGTTCHQWPGRSYFLFGPEFVTALDERTLGGLGMAHEFLGSASTGFKMAYCERNFAIYTTVFLAGLVYALLRRRVRPLSPRLFVVCLLPLAFDGVTQLVGWRESTWELRTLTGALAGLIGVWLIYPRLERTFQPATARPRPVSLVPSGLTDSSPGRLG